MLYSEDKSEIGCRDAQYRMSLYIKGDPSLSRRQRDFFEAHLKTCSVCRREFEEYKGLIEFVGKYWGPVSEETRKLLIKGSYQVAESTEVPPYRAHLMTTAESWEDLKRRCPSLAQTCRRQGQIDCRRRLFWRIGTVAAAASILIAVCIGLIVLQNRDDRQTGPDIVATRIHDSTPENAFAELITSSGRRKLTLGQPFKTADRPQEILLGGKHRVVMNRETSARFTACRSKSDMERQARYDIQLSKGELYVEVVPGNPFLVRTDNAMLTITGTKFNVRSQGGLTELTLLEGSVRFSRHGFPEQRVNVTAGYASSIVGLSAPSTPKKVDARAAVAWSHDLAINNALARIPLEDDLLGSIRDSWLRPSPPDLDSLDYDAWTERHRQWFSREFPWLLQTQKYLTERNGIEVDYVELLMVSGDIWQFNYPRQLNNSIPVFDPVAIERVAKHYEVDCARLLEAVQPSSYKPNEEDKQLTGIGQDKGPAEAYQAAMRNWQADVASAAECSEGLSDDLLLFSLRAGTYLANTRTAAYLWIKEHSSEDAILQANAIYRFEYLTRGSPVEITTIDFLREHVYGQVAAAQKVANTLCEYLIAPMSGTNTCEPHVGTQMKQLSEQILTLTENEPG